MRAVTPLSVFRRRWIRTFGSLVAACVMASNCGGGGDASTGPITPTVSSVTISGAPAENVVTLGKSAQLVATAKDASGATLTSKTVTWTSSNNSIATVSSAGLVTAVAVGVATITATSEGKASSTDIAVRAEISVPPANATQPVTTTALGGEVTMVVPPGATTVPALSVAPALPAVAPAVPELVSGTAVTFGPDGTQFAKPLTLSLKYDPTGMTTEEIAGLALYYAVNGDYVLIPGSGPVPGNFVQGDVSHFSTIGILKKAVPASISINAGNGQVATVGTAVAVRPSVILRDNRNRPVTGAPVTFTVTSGGGSLTGATALTDLNGIATVGSWTLGSLPGGNSISASFKTSFAANFTATGTAAPTPTIGLSSSSATFTYAAGTAAPASQSITVSNTSVGTVSGLALGAPTYSAGATGWLSTSISGTTAPATITLGLAPGTISAGTYTATFPVTSASASNSPQTVTVTLTVTGLGANKLGIVTQPASPQSGVVLTAQPVVEVRDANGVKVNVPDFDVTASIASGTGTLTGTTTVKSVNGVATFTNLVLSGSGSITLNFAAPGLTSVVSNAIVYPPGMEITPTSASFTAVFGLAASPASSVLNIKSAAASAGLAVGSISYSNGVTGWLTPVLAGATTPTTLTLSANSAGLAPGTYQANVVITSTNSTSLLVPVTFVVTPLPPTQLTMGTQPSVGESGVALSPVTVQLRNVNNVVALGFTNSITASIASGTGTLTGTTTVAAVNGTATFSDLKIAGAGAHTITFTSTGLTPTTSTAITISQVVRQVSITTQPNGAVNGVVFTQQPVVALADAAGLPVPGASTAITAAVASGSGALSGTLTVNAVNGIATFTNLKLTGSGAHTLSFAAPGATTATSASFNILAAPPSQLALTTQPSLSNESGVVLATQPVVEVRDALNGKVLGATTAVTVALASGTGTLSGTTTVNAVNGVAAFSGLKISGSGPHTLAFTAGTLTPVTSSAISVNQVVRQIVIGTQPSGAVSGFNFTTQPVLQLKDAAGLAMSGATNTVTASIATGTGGTLSGTVAMAAVGGVVTYTDLKLSGTPGTFTLAFNTAGATTATSANVNLTSAPATQVAIATAGSTTSESGVVFAAQPVIEIRDGTNTKVGGSTNAVTASIASGTGTLAGTTTVNAVNGVATFTNLKINGAGAHTLTFASAGLTSATSATITVSQVVRQLALTTQPNGGVSGFVFTTQPVVQLSDAAGLPFNSTAAVTASIASGTGTLAGTTTVNAVNGVATFTDLKISGTPGSFVLAFASPGATTVNSTSFGITSAPATQLVGTTAVSSSAESGVAFATQPVIEIRDGTNTKVAGATNAVTVAIATGTGTLGGTTTVNAVNGVATFTNLKITGSGAHTLTYSSPSLTSATSGSIAVNQVVRSVGIITQPSGAVSGFALTTQPVVNLLDAGGLLVQSSANVTATVSFGPGVLSGTATVAAVNGVATFTNLIITNAGLSTLTFSSGSATPATSALFPVGQPPATQVAVTTAASSSSESGVAFATQPVVEIRDAFNGKVLNSTNAVTVSLASGTGTLGGTTTVNAVNGVATFTNLKISGSGNHTLTYAAAGLTSVTSGTIAVTQVVRSATITTPPSGAVTGQAFTQQPVLQLKDFAGLNVPQAGFALTASVNGGGTLSGTTTANSNASGVVSFSNLAIAPAGNYTLTFTGTGVTTTSASFAVASQVADRLVTTVLPSTSAETGTPFATQPVVEIRDASNQRVLGGTQQVTATITSGTGVIQGTVTVIAVNGIATFTDLQIKGSGANTITFTSAGLTSSSGGTVNVSVILRALVLTTNPAGAVSGFNFTTQPVIEMRDASNTLIPLNSNVTVRISSGTGTLAGTLSVAAVNGVATFTDLKITGTGNNTLWFEAAADASVLRQFVINVTPAPATQLAVVTQPSLVAGVAVGTNIETGVVFANQPVVEIRDAFGAKVLGATNAVTVSIGTGSGTLQGTATVNAVNGTATFAGLKINGSGTHTLAFAAAGLTGATSAPVNITNQPRSIVITTQPGGSVSGTPLGVQPVLQLKDNSGANANTAQSVTAAIASGTGTLSGTTTVSAVNGVVSFTDLTITGGGTHTLSFTSAGVTTATSSSFTITAPAATQLAIATQPSAAVESGVNFPVQPVIEIRDAGNALVAGSTANVTVALASGSGALSGTTTVAAVNGVATFTNLKISGAGNHTLTFTSGTLTAATSGTIAVMQTPGSVVVTTQPSATATDGVAFVAQPVITIRDKAGLTIAGSTLSVTASVFSGTPTLSGTTTVAAVNGVATFAGLKLTGTGTSVLTFALTATPAIAVQSNSIVVSAAVVNGIKLNVGAAAATSVTVGQDITVPVLIDMSNRGTDDLASITVTVTWDPAKFTLKSQVVGDWNDDQSGSASYFLNPTNPTVSGSQQISAFTNDATTHSFTLRTYVLTAIASGSSSITASVTTAGNVNAGTITVAPRNLAVTINP